jgi:hypothetical protein
MSYRSADIIDFIQRKIVEREDDLAKLNEALELVKSVGHHDPCGTKPAISPDEFTHTPLALCVCRYLELIKPRGAKDDEIVEALKTGGWVPKKYPKRQISLSVANSPDRLERREDDLIYLKRKEIE